MKKNGFKTKVCERVYCYHRAKTCNNFINFNKTKMRRDFYKNNKPMLVPNL